MHEWPAERTCCVLTPPQAKQQRGRWPANGVMYIYIYNQAMAQANHCSWIQLCTKLNQNLISAKEQVLQLTFRSVHRFSCHNYVSLHLSLCQRKAYKYAEYLQKQSKAFIVEPFVCWYHLCEPDILN